MAAPLPKVFEHRDPWTEPIAVTLDLAALATTTRPPD